MIKFEETEVVGWRHAIRGMRNALESWEKSDSGYGCYDEENEERRCNNGICDPKMSCDIREYIIGPNDHYLMMRLREAGTDHRKFLRMIVVYVDITAPLYWWKEFDTYKIGTVCNSCSTMHSIHKNEFTLDDFSCEHLIQNWGDLDRRDGIVLPCTPMDRLQQLISNLNVSRKRFLETKIKPMKDENARQELLKKYWWQMIQLLPTSYNQKRTIMISYEVLANIYKSRKNHKLDEWKEHNDDGYFGFCDWIKTLPYSELITGDLRFEENTEELKQWIREEKVKEKVKEIGDSIVKGYSDGFKDTLEKAEAADTKRNEISDINWKELQKIIDEQIEKGDRSVMLSANPDIHYMSLNIYPYPDYEAVYEMYKEGKISENDFRVKMGLPIKAYTVRSKE